MHPGSRGHDRFARTSLYLGGFSDSDGISIRWIFDTMFVVGGLSVGGEWARAMVATSQVGRFAYKGVFTYAIRYLPAYGGGFKSINYQGGKVDGVMRITPWK